MVLQDIRINRESGVSKNNLVSATPFLGLRHILIKEFVDAHLPTYVRHSFSGSLFIWSCPRVQLWFQQQLVVVIETFWHAAVFCRMVSDCIVQCRQYASRVTYTKHRVIAFISPTCFYTPHEPILYLDHRWLSATEHQPICMHYGGWRNILRKREALLQQIYWRKCIGHELCAV